jgi:hypothetical protein
MLSEAPKLQINAPIDGTMPGRGFYQLEDDTLYVPIGAPSKARFFSYIESEQVRLDLDKSGRLLLFEVERPRRHWPIDGDLAEPIDALPADIRWLDFRETIANPQIRTNANRGCLLLQFSTVTPSRAFYLADNVILRADENDRLVSIYVGKIEDDLAGQEIRRFRRQCRQEAARQLEPVGP